MKLSFVIPCYGSENTIENVVLEIKEKVKEKKEYNYEIILVNDHSYDNVWNKIQKICKKDKSIIGLNFAKNMNKPGAVMAGLRHVTGDIIILLDDDGQCPINELWTLINPVLEGHDISVAKYPVKKQSKFKNFGSAVNKKMAEVIIDKPKNIYFNNYSAMKSYVAKEMTNYTNPYPYLEGLMLSITKDIVNVEIEERERFDGKTNFTLKKMLSLWFNGFTSFSVKPLRISTYIGFVIAILGFIYGSYTIINKILNPEVLLGYSSIMAAILFIGGIIMIMLGLVGEYVGRIYISINNSPQYVIKEKINVKD